MKVFGAIENVQIEWFTDAGKPSAASNPYRIIYVTDLKELQISDGSTWTRYQGASMAAQTVKANPTTSAAVGQDVSIASGFMFRNRVINGGMRIDQRNNGGAITSNGFPVDRFFASHDIGSFTFSSQRSTTAPNGFINSLQFTATNAQTPSVSQQCNIGQIIEGNMISEMMFGTANATTFTLSFWVRSSVATTGSQRYCVSFRNSSENRSYVAEYTISSANTWEYKTITVQGDTSGTWLADTGRGLTITWNLSGGSNFNTTANSWSSGNFLKTSNQVNFTGNSGATFFLTGVQLEVGSLATPFERRPITIEETLCYRYYERYVGGLTWGYIPHSADPSRWGNLFYKVHKRVNPSVSGTTTGVGLSGSPAFYTRNQGMSDWIQNCTSASSGYAVCDSYIANAEF